jgi:hypothetical protein
MGQPTTMRSSSRGQSFEPAIPSKIEYPWLTRLASLFCQFRRPAELSSFDLLVFFVDVQRLPYLHTSEHVLQDIAIMQHFPVGGPVPSSLLLTTSSRFKTSDSCMRFIMRTLFKENRPRDHGNVELRTNVNVLPEAAKAATSQIKGTFRCCMCCVMSVPSSERQPSIAGGSSPTKISSLFGKPCPLADYFFWSVSFV